MSVLHCDRCGAPWSNHENCDDDPNAQTRHLQHIEQLNRELSECQEELKELREAHGGAVLAVHSAVERAEALDREIAALRKSNAELVKSANEIFLVDPSANVPRFFAAVRELKSAITLATEPKP